MNRCMRIILLAVSIVFLSTTMLCAVENYPVRDIKHIMPWDAGGGTDIVMRAFMSRMEKHLGATVYTVNIVGAKSGLGVQELMNSKPDGYTIGTLTWDSIITVPYFALVPNYDLDRLDFIATVTEQATIIAVHSASPWKTVKDLVEDAKKNPEKIAVSNVGVGGVWHLPVLDLESKAGVKFRHVSFPGGAGEQREALLKREVEVACITISGIMPALKSGDARILGVMSDERLPEYPDIPTFKELGYDCVWGSMRVVATPKGVADLIKAKLEEACYEAAHDQDWKDWLATAGGGGWTWRGSKDTELYLEKVKSEAFALMDALVAQGVLKK
jgi:tripartite-type tricarboxylate transporter receptor subunit TctC